jgi:HAD superfamily hydrolase (TIGR01490 family)
MADTMPSDPIHSPTRIVVFDVDGTLIQGHSQILFAHDIVRRGEASRVLLIQIGWWYALYRLGIRLPVAQIQRRMVGAFAGMPIDHLHSMLDAFTTDVLADRLFPDALAELSARRRDGAHIVLVSASLDMIIDRLARMVGADGAVATRLVPPIDGRLSGRIESEMVYGAAKLAAMRRYADERFNDWVIDTAYGDHESDQFLLAAAERAVVVNPDQRLETIARRSGWQVVRWRRSGDRGSAGRSTGRLRR